MKNKIIQFYKESYKIREFEKKLIDLFSKGLINGTTHTCIGQENNAVGVAAALDKKDIMLSNHRCHGHFLAHTNQYEGLINEILGNDNGVCQGIGGSQHLFYDKIFYSNGILGGNAPMAAGLAFANKLKKNKKVVCIFIGDGSFGEGTIYETLNFVSVFKLPILIVVEDNGIAQTTDTKETLSNSIYNISKGFNINITQLNYPDAFEIYKCTSKIIPSVKSNKPQIIILKSTRLGPHSKGDDTRSATLINKLTKLDPLKKLEKRIKNIKKVRILNQEAKTEIEKLFKSALESKSKKNSYSTENKNLHTKVNNKDYFHDFRGKRFGEKINHFFHKLSKEDNKVLFFGEDIVDPYGGAFKITKNLKVKFKEQIYSTPISEATIVGMSSGLAIEGYKPIVEIMFGDFLSLTFDQILNNLSKFYSMYNRSIKLPLIIRTPMGAGRGYGPTHSQSIEKYFFGIIGLNVYSLNTMFPIDRIYLDAFNNSNPNLIIENKKQYNFILSDLNEAKYKSFNIKNDIENFLTKLSLTNFQDENITIICHGGVSEKVINSVYSFYLDSEISCRILILSRLNPLNCDSIKNNLALNSNVIVIEESHKSYGLGSEIGAHLYEDENFKNIKFLRISSQEKIIPASLEKENDVIISEKKIINLLKEFAK